MSHPRLPGSCCSRIALAAPWRPRRATRLGKAPFRVPASPPPCSMAGLRDHAVPPTQHLLPRRGLFAALAVLDLPPGPAAAPIYRIDERVGSIACPSSVLRLFAARARAVRGPVPRASPHPSRAGRARAGPCRGRAAAPAAGPGRALPHVARLRRGRLRAPPLHDRRTGRPPRRAPDQRRLSSNDRDPARHARLPNNPHAIRCVALPARVVVDA